jgi:hypothetical protein
MIATFANGTLSKPTSDRRDGVHSRVRSQFINDGEPVNRGYTIWRGTSPIHTCCDYRRRLELSFTDVESVSDWSSGLGRTGWWAQRTRIRRIS